MSSGEFLKPLVVMVSNQNVLSNPNVLSVKGNGLIHNSTGCQPKKNNGFKNIRRLEIKANRRKK
jgi:hypothetical protein